jgi:hypothetical protein
MVKRSRKVAVVCGALVGLAAGGGATAQPTFRVLVEEFPSTGNQEAYGTDLQLGRRVVGQRQDGPSGPRVGFVWDTNPANPAASTWFPSIGTLPAAPANSSSALWAIDSQWIARGTSTIDPILFGTDRRAISFSQPQGLVTVSTTEGGAILGINETDNLLFGYQSIFFVGQGVRRVPATWVFPSFAVNPGTLRGQFWDGAMIDGNGRNVYVGSTRQPGVPGTGIDGIIFFNWFPSTQTFPQCEFVAVTNRTGIFNVLGTDLSGTPKPIIRALTRSSAFVGPAADLLPPPSDPGLGRFVSTATPDGRVVYGYTNFSLGVDNGDFDFTARNAWVHFPADPGDPDTGPLTYDLLDYLTGLGIDTRGWFVQRVADTTADGTVVVGRVFSANGNRFSAFRAVVPPRNSRVEGARRLSAGQPVPTNFKLYGSDGQASCGVPGAPAAYFSFTPSWTGTYEFSTGVATDTITITFPNGSNGPEQIACGSGPQRVPIRAGNRVIVRVAGDYGPGIRNVRVDDLGLQNLCCLNGAQIVGGPASFAADRGRPTFVRYVVPVTGTVTLRACDTQVPAGSPGYDGFRVEVSIGCSGCERGLPIIANLTSQLCPDASAQTIPVFAGDVLTFTILTVANATTAATGAVGQLSISQSACGLPQNDSYQSRVFNSGPGGYWRLAEPIVAVTTAADEVFRATDTCGRTPGTYTGATGFVSVPSPVIGPGLRGKQFSGTRRIANIALMPTANDAFRSEAIEAWVRTTTPLAGTILTGRDADAVTTNTLVIGAVGPFQFPGRAAFLLDGPGIIRGAVGTTNIADGNWHHVVGTRDFFVDFSTGQLTLNYRIYVNGRQEGVNNVSTGTISTLAPTAGTSWSIGDHPSWRNAGLTDFFQGELAEVAAFNGRQSQPNPSAVLSTSLTAAEIAARYNAATGTCKPILQSDLSGTLPFVARVGRTVNLVVPILRGPVTTWTWSRGGTTLAIGPTGNGGAYTNVAGATSEWTAATLTIQNVALADSGLYTARVSTPCPDFSDAPVNLQVFCRFDYNFDGQRTPADIFAFLNLYFAANPETDFDNNGVRNPSDIFAFLNAYFANQCS